jgi:hypothetical protein
MLGYINIDYQFQVDLIKLRAKNNGYQFLNFASHGSDLIHSKIVNNDMFASNSNNFIIKFDKDNINEVDTILKANSEVNIIILTLSIDKRTSSYKNLIKFYDSAPGWLIECQDYKKALFITIDNSSKVKLKSLHLLNTKNLNYDELVNQINLKYLESDEPELDLADMEIFNKESNDQSMFDAALLLVGGHDVDIDSMIQRYGSDPIWNTIIWYVDSIIQIKTVGSRHSSIKLNSYTASKILNIKISSKSLNLVYNCERMLKAGTISADSAIRIVTASFRDK